MQEDLAKKLVAFGLTINQAKIYLSIIQFGSTRVNAISRTTQLHRQDIYKTLPKLEEMGLITKTIDMPITIKAIPVEKALNHLISTERRKAKQRILHLKADLNALINAIKKTQEEKPKRQQEEQVVFLSTDNTIRHNLDHAYENAKTNCDLVMNYELLTQRIDALRWRFQKLAANKVKTRLLFETTQNIITVKRTLTEVIPKTGNFKVKLTTGKITIKPYVIIDNKEVYITTRKKTKMGLPCVLWTNSRDIISIYKENFEKAWKSPHTVTIYQTKTSSKKEKTSL